MPTIPRRYSVGNIWAALLALTAPTLSAANDPFLDALYSVTVTSDILYTSAAVQSPAPGTKDLHLDLYEPSGAGVPALKPGFVFLHGGGFNSGTKTNSPMVDLATEYAERGYVAISIDYRLTDDDPPTPGEDYLERVINAVVEDTVSALTWLRANAATYGVDPDRIAVGGYSAGAIAAMYTAYRELGPDAEVQAVMCLAGALYGDESIIDAGDPPVVMIHGTTDTDVEHFYAVDIETAALAVPITCDFYSLTGIGHGIPAQLDQWTENGVTLDIIMHEFFFNQLNLLALSDPQSTVHVDFNNDGLETGSVARPYNALNEALGVLEYPGTVQINGTSPAVTTTETFSGAGMLTQPLTLQVAPVGLSPVQIGAPSARQSPPKNQAGFVSREN